MRLLTRVAGKDAKVVLVPGNRESVPRVRCALLCNAAPAPSLHRNTTYRSHFHRNSNGSWQRHRSATRQLYMRKSDCKSGAFSKTAARPRPDLE